MKHLIISLTTLFALIGMMNLSEAKLMEVQGSLHFMNQDEINAARPVITTAFGDFPISGVETYLEQCTNGTFLVQENLSDLSDPRGTYILWESFGCESTKDLFELVSLDQDEQGPIFCPEIYQPVCGHNGHESWTYSNLCHLNADKAVFLGNGQCSNLSL